MDARQATLICSNLLCKETVATNASLLKPILALIDADRNAKGQFMKGPRVVNQWGWALNITETHKECRKCNKLKLHSDFSKDVSNKYGLGYWCKDCVNKNSRRHHLRKMKEVPAYRLAMRDRYMRGRFGFNWNEYRDRLQAQSNKCAICDIALLPTGFGTHLDHCHKTGKLRAFLCTNCNRGLGHFKDSPEFLEKAAQYLKTHNGHGSHKEVAPL